MMDTNLVTLIEQFRSEDRCRAYLERLRWPNGIHCPRCKSAKISRIIKRNQFDCDGCRYQFSVTVGTKFGDTHLPLWKWFLAVNIICDSKKGVSANQLKRMLGVSYKTAWYLCHRIRAAMASAQEPKLDGTVELDETYVGGKNIGKGKVCRWDNKQVVVGIRKRGGDLRFFHAADAKSGTLARYIQENIREDVEVLVTDDYSSHPVAMRKTGMRAKHRTINHSSKVYVVGDIHTNTIESAFSLLKRGVVGTWHKISAKHLAAYLNEMAFRFNNRRNPRLFQLTLSRLLESGTLPFSKLTEEAA